MSGGQARSRLSELDGVRAVAILMVIAFHSWFFLSHMMTSRADYHAVVASIPWWLGYVRRGDLGVDIFFVLSGFLLGRQLLAQRARTGRLNYRRYFAHRLLRIYPLYLVALAIAVAVSGPTWSLLGDIFTYNIWLPDGRLVIPWAWSLSVELEFYLAIPFIILAIS
ncbi:MAG TPA: acyltransferase, partial [Aliiroseovarius sp.]|nr:acyltransferase [Aliiroseovarius sp.]